MEKLFTLVVHQLVEIDIDPVCCLVDGHPTNRKCYRELCGGNLEVSIINPANISSFIHLLVDPTHILKCVYNNFFTRRLSKFSDFAGEHIEANFDHIVSLYKREFGKSPKFAYKLTDKVLYPNGIEKTSVKLTDALFRSSTINGLKVYGEKSNPEFLNTARFLQIIRDWWDHFNVKAKDVGSKKRDPNKNPISIENLEEKAERFQAILEWLRKWQESCKENKMNGLNDETFLTFQQSTSSIISFASYLIHQCHFKFVLTGKVQIEGRFGWWRQSWGVGGGGGIFTPQ